jgi:hypothetical protein
VIVQRPPKDWSIPPGGQPGLIGAQVGVDVAGGLAAVGDGPDDQALAALGVAGGEDAGNGGGELGGLDVAAPVELDAQLLHSGIR